MFLTGRRKTSDTMLFSSSFTLRFGSRKDDKQQNFFNWLSTTKHEYFENLLNIILVPRAGFEPATTRSSAERSPRLSYLGTFWNDFGTFESAIKSMFLMFIYVFVGKPNCPFGKHVQILPLHSQHGLVFLPCFVLKTLTFW